MILFRLRFLAKALLGVVRLTVGPEDVLRDRSAPVLIWLCDADPAEDWDDADEPLFGEWDVEEEVPPGVVRVDIPPGCMWSDESSGSA